MILEFGTWWGNRSLSHIVDLPLHGSLCEWSSLDLELKLCWKLHVLSGFAPSPWTAIMLPVSALQYSELVLYSCTYSISVDPLPEYIVFSPMVVDGRDTWHLTQHCEGFWIADVQLYASCRSSSNLCYGLFSGIINLLSDGQLKLSSCSLFRSPILFSNWFSAWPALEFPVVFIGMRLHVQPQEDHRIKWKRLWNMQSLIGSRLLFQPRGSASSKSKTYSTNEQNADAPTRLDWD